MGCGALTFRHTKTVVEECPVGANDESKTEDELPRTQNYYQDDEATDGVGSPSPSVHSTSNSVISSLVTGGSSRYYCKNSSFCDDLRSDVPTIAESIADMQDFQDLPILTASASGRFSSCSSVSEEDRHRAVASHTPRGSNVSSATIIDTRMHPLAVMSGCSGADTQSCNPTVGDLGGCSDVPSLRDDMSVTSAPSDICVSFPPCEPPASLGSTTPPRTQMKALSGFKTGTTSFRRPSNERCSAERSNRIALVKESPLLSLVVGQSCVPALHEAIVAPSSSPPAGLSSPEEEAPSRVVQH